MPRVAPSLSWNRGKLPRSTAPSGEWQTRARHQSARSTRPRSSGARPCSSPPWTRPPGQGSPPASSPARGETEPDALPPLEEERYMPIRGEWSREDTVPGSFDDLARRIREQLASQSFPSAPAEPSVAQGKLSPLPSATARASDPALGNIVSNANYRQGVRFRGGGRRPARRRPVAGGASRRRRRR